MIGGENDMSDVVSFLEKVNKNAIDSKCHVCCIINLAKISPESNLYQVLKQFFQKPHYY